jgi:glutamyl-tRNA reductase
MDRCEKLVDHQIETLRRHLLDRALSPAAQGMHRSFREVADRALKHTLSRELSHLGDDDREAVERMTAGLVKRLVQVPLKGLKGAAWHHSSAVIDGFLKGLDDNGPNGGGRSS